MKTRQQYIKELHILLNRCNIRDDKQAVYGSYGVGSSREMSLPQLSELCEKLHALLQKDGKEPAPSPCTTPLKKAQTRCKVAIGKLLAAQGCIPVAGWGIVEWDMVQRVACRAAGVEHFDRIPLSKLRGITFEFNKQRQAIENSRQLIMTKDLNTENNQSLTINNK